MLKWLLGDPEDFVNGKVPAFRKLLPGKWWYHPVISARKRTSAFEMLIPLLRYLKCFR